MQILRTVDEARSFVRAHRGAGRRVGLVPTMGALHEGHLALMRAAAAHAQVVVASIFVNPTQFGPHEDLETYPRHTARDLTAAEKAGCHAVFLPSVEVMYGAGAATTVAVPALAEHLCGRSRPSHFAGVCVAVLKLFNIIGCDVAVFGEKDYQQLAIIRRMVRDLNVPVEIVGHPIVRGPDGLALSSRNASLSTDQRAAAVGLSDALRRVGDAWRSGQTDAATLRALVVQRLEAAKGGRIDYVEVCDLDDLTPLAGPIEGGFLVAVAVFFGKIRLIDNAVFAPGG
jgi:pantoate--beta-alanine ligase